MSFDYSYVIKPTGLAENHIVREMFDDVKAYINGGNFASAALDNLSSVAINTSLVSDTDNTDDLGSATIAWKDLYLDGDIKVGSTTAIDLAASGAVSIRGTTTNDEPAAGFIGEYLESKSATAANSPATGTWGDAASLALTAGDWDLTLQIYHIKNTGTWTITFAGISTTSGNDGTGLSNADNLLSNAWASSSTTPLQNMITISNYRVLLDAPTTYYAKVRATYTAGQPQYAYRFSARRRR